MVQVVNIDSKYEVLLGFLYPTYTITDSPSVTSKFIIHRDIKSKSEREALDFMYDDCIFISRQIFDKFLDEDELKKLAIDFSRKVLKNRKYTIETTTETFVEDIKTYMYSLNVAEEQSIFELFDCYGSNLFLSKFMELSTKIPVQVLSSAMNTFISKILNADSLYYKKKAVVLLSKINSNVKKAVDSYLLREKDNYGLSLAKFYIDLIND